MLKTKSHYVLADKTTQNFDKYLTADYLKLSFVYPIENRLNATYD